MPARVLLLLPTTSYKAEAFLAAAGALGVDVLVGTDRRQALEGEAPGHSVALSFGDVAGSLQRVLAAVAGGSIDAVVGVDDETTQLAAALAARLGLRHNPVNAVAASRDKHAMRRRLAGAGLRGPAFRRWPIATPPEQAAAAASYPCVLKPLSLSASRGVLRADDPTSFIDAFRRIEAILARRDVAARRGDADHVMVEDYLPGDEVAVEALLDGGRMRVLALFDKPDPLVGPTFEETLFVTPSRHPGAVCRALEETTAAGCRALGLREGPVHAELRVHEGTPVVLEVAARTIGGLCSRTLRFGTGLSLEEVVLRHALGLDTSSVSREQRAAGVMMIPIPGAGVLRGVHGLEAAGAVPLIEEVTISIHTGGRVEPLPEGNQYLGFIFARGDRPQDVEDALRQAHDRLRFDIVAG